MQNLSWFIDHYGKYFVFLWPLWGLIKKLVAQSIKQSNKMTREQQLKEVEGTQPAKVPGREPDREIARLLTALLLVFSLVLCLLMLVILRPVISQTSPILTVIACGVIAMMFVSVIALAIGLPPYNSFMNWNDESKFLKARQETHERQIQNLLEIQRTSEHSLKARQLQLEAGEFPAQDLLANLPVQPSLFMSEYSDKSEANHLDERDHANEVRSEINRRPSVTSKSKKKPPGSTKRPTKKNHKR
jgi:hypothetical protein